MMKNIIITIVLFFSALLTLFGQAPQSFKYQAMARDAMDQPVENQNVALRFSFLEDHSSGPVIYSETHNVLTSEYGVFTVEIGFGDIESGDFNGLDWANFEYWLKVELDLSGGSNYKFMGASQFLSVPYALHAQTVTEKNDADADPSNEIQSISFNPNSNELTISDGNTITIPSGGTDADADPTNEIQNLSLNALLLEISGGNQVDLSSIASPWRPASWGGIYYDEDQVYTAMQQVEDYVRVGNNNPTSSKLTDEGLYVDHYNGDGTTAKLLGNSLSFETKDDPYIWSNFGLTGLQVNEGNIWPGYSQVEANKITLGSGLNISEWSSFQATMNDILDSTEMNLTTHGLRLDTVDSYSDLTYGKLFFSGMNPLQHHSRLDKDSLEFFNENTGLLFNSKSNLNADILRFEYGPDYSSYDASRIFMDNTINQTWFSPYGIQNEQHIGAFESFLRFSLEPDSLYMANAAKWSTVKLGTNMENQTGELKLYGNGNQVHSYLGVDEFGFGRMAMYFEDKQRVGIWSFEDNGLITITGKNETENAYMGAAHLHQDPNMGGIGVMDDTGLIKAGIEVDPLNNGVVYSRGKFQILDDNYNEATITDFSGFSLVNPDNGQYTASLYRDFFDHNVGFLALDGSSSANVLAGANYDQGGNSNTGMVEVSNAEGYGKAGMYVFTNGESALYADDLSLGVKPIGPTTYPLNIVQKASFGFNMVSVDGTEQNWEFYINDTGNLTLYNSGGLMGSFSQTDGSYNQISDEQLKTNIRSIGKVLSPLMKLEASTYKYKGRETSVHNSIGFIAQDVQKLFPELVLENVDKEGEHILSINYSGLSVIAIKAIQEQQEIIDTQEQKIKDMEQRLERLEAILSK